MFTPGPQPCIRCVDSPHLLGELDLDAGLSGPTPGSKGSWGQVRHRACSFWRREGQRLEGQHQTRGPEGAEVGMEQEWVGARPGVRESGEGRLRRWWDWGSPGLHSLCGEGPPEDLTPSPLKVSSLSLTTPAEVTGSSPSRWPEWASRGPARRRPFPSWTVSGHLAHPAEQAQGRISRQPVQVEVSTFSTLAAEF